MIPCAVTGGNVHRKPWVLCLCVCVLASRSGSALAQQAQTTDARLTVREGLGLWFDASRINAALVAAGEKELASGDAIYRWNDTSEGEHHLSQPRRDWQPKLLKVGEDWVVRFDGQDDYLRYEGHPDELQSTTIFLVASPHANPGEFRGFFATNAKDQRDYVSGLNIDLGPGPTFKFEQVNIEGRGFGGAADLQNKAEPFGKLHVLETIVDPQAKLVKLVTDGEPQGTRPFTPSPISFQQLTLGARYYTNGPQSQQVRGPVAADIAEVLVYDRALTEDESVAVRRYLDEKYAKLREELPKTIPGIQRAGIELVKVESPPAIQMLVPGFTVRELPVELTNLNNVRYREDGKLVTLGYNGDIHLLSDTDGDGLEDHAELFWKNEGSLRGPIGIVLTPPEYAKGRGLFVSSKGKLSLIVDTDGDDKADEEIVVATGWNEITQNVDAVGLAMDTNGDLYFGLGTANYADAYLIDKQGISAYDLKSDRGTVQRVSADFSRRETVCTGIRFPIAFGFNKEGDLFCTEQEGATWLPNGNPFDELLHIQSGRHYGFPPRHPRHNPDVLDEPSTFDFGPQHQSTCGMVFNTPVNGGPIFGPDWWIWNALVTGESRGKIWRTQTVKTKSGYVAQSQLIACLQMLTVDNCVAATGDLIVACHSGPPDWGTGPAGIGKLFRISMSNKTAPRPVAAWAESNQEIRVTFDQPLDPLVMRNLTERIEIQYGEYVRAGDRYETLVPPYAVVQRQLMTPRYALPVTGASLTSDLHTIIINTAPMTAFAHYAVSLPSPAPTPEAPGTLTQQPRIDLDVTLNGVWTEWTPSGTDIPAWSGWLPHADLEVSRQLLAGSAYHKPLWNALKLSGTLTLRTKAELRNILRPAIQPGATIDYEWPMEQVKLSAAAFGVVLEDARSTPHATSEFNGDTFVVKLATGQGDLDLSLSLSTNEDPRPRPVPLHRFILPWADPNAKSQTPLEPITRNFPELEGGSWGRGRLVFRSEAAGCFKCHTLLGDTGKIGPDLHGLLQRDYASVMRDLINPSFAINPDHIGHVISLKDGRILTGVLRTEGGELLLGDEKGNTTKISKDDIDQMKAAEASIMPKGLLDKLSKEQVRDLLTYLLMPPPKMPLDSPLPAPPIRTQAEVAAALADAPPHQGQYRPMNIVLVAGEKDHGPGEHDYPAWQQAWLELLTADPALTISTAWDFPNEEQFSSADVLVFFQRGSFDENRQGQLDAYLQRGGGAVYLHWAVDAGERAWEFSERIGLATDPPKIKYRHGPLTLDMHNAQHPILRNFTKLDLYDESYWKMIGDPSKFTLLATSIEDNEPTPQMWVLDHQPGRVFVSIPGHYNWTFDDPLFRIILLRGIAWTAKEPVDRFNDLVPLGARLSR